MKEIFPVLSLFVLFFACVLIMVTLAKKILSVVTVFEYERGLRYTKGNFSKLLGPGQYWIFSLWSAIDKVDVRPAYLTISNQEMMTHDGTAVKLSLSVYYEVTDPVIAVNQNENYNQALYLLVQLAVRELVATLKLNELIENREALNENLILKLTPQVDHLGIRVHSVRLKDITLPSELKKAFAQVVQAQKEGLANLERVRSETASLRNLVNAAKLLEDNPKLMNLRVLQTLGETSGNKIVLNVCDEKINP